MSQINDDLTTNAPQKVMGLLYLKSEPKREVRPSLIATFAPNGDLSPCEIRIMYRVCPPDFPGNLELSPR